MLEVHLIKITNSVDFTFKLLLQLRT